MATATQAWHELDRPGTGQRPQVDVDVSFVASPDALLLSTQLHFAATRVPATRVPRGKSYDLNTHLMVVTPNEEVVSLLLARARARRFVPQTNTEQGEASLGELLWGQVWGGCSNGSHDGVDHRHLSSCSND